MTMISCAPDEEGRVPSPFHFSLYLPTGKYPIYFLTIRFMQTCSFPEPSKFSNLLTLHVDLINYIQYRQNCSLLSSCRCSYFPQSLIKFTAYHLLVKLLNQQKLKISNPHSALVFFSDFSASLLGKK